MKNKIRSFMAFFLAITLVILNCFSAISSDYEIETDNTVYEEGDSEPFVYEPSFSSLGDKGLLAYVEDNVYLELVSELNSSDYYVEKVEAIYISQEYLDEVAFNSQANIFFGYTLEEIEDIYADSRFVFTLGENGETVVEPFEDYDDTYDRIIKNVAVGTGVILVCVTVSVVTAGAGAPAVSLIFAASAKTGTAMALSSGAIGGIASGVVTGVKTGDMKQALKEGALAASEGFKWGAISGAISGGAAETAKYAKAMKALKGKDLHISMQEAAAIQMETGYPPEVISQFHSMDEFKIFKNANLKAKLVNGKTALVRSDIDTNLVDEFGRTNLQRMKSGLAPLDSTGKSFELHHIGQESDATLAIFTNAEHHNNTILHGFKEVSEIDRTAFASTRKDFWKAMATMLESGGL